MYNIAINLELEPYVGGSYQYWYSIIQALSNFDKEKYNIYGIYMDDRWKGILLESGIPQIKIRQSKRGIVYKTLERALWRWDRQWIRKLLILMNIKISDSILIRRLKLDLILDNGSGFARAYGIKVAVPIHDLMHRYEKDIPELVEGLDYREKLFSSEAKYADIILADSLLGKKHIIESYGENCSDIDAKVEVLPFIPPSYIYTDHCENSELVLPDKYIFYPAQFWSHKNHVNLLKALAHLKKQGIFVSLVLSGSRQNNYEQVLRSIEELELKDQVMILGYVTNSDIVYIYRNARALVYPTLFGPTNIPPLEAFYLGCPVAASGIYAMPEQLGDAALYFDPRSVDEIADVIKQLWLDDELCRQLSQRGLEQAKKWGPVQFSERLEEIIEKHLVN